MRTSLRSLPALLVFAVPSATLGAQEQRIDASIISAHTRFLADDLLEGRGTGSEGIRLAALYIEAQCRALGLEPVGVGYRQPVPLEEARVLPSTGLAAFGPRGTVEFLYGADFVPNVGSRETLIAFRGPAVFVGRATDIARGRIGGLNLEGRVAITVGPIPADASDTLLKRGTAGMVHLVTEASAFDAYVRSRGVTRLYHRDPTVKSSFLPALPSILAGPRVARALLDGVLVTRDGEPVLQELSWTVQANVSTDSRPVDEENVVCLLRGADSAAADTVIALTAHYDHLGVSVPDAHSDSIYNGFSDNAAGVAMLLAIAASLTAPDAVPLRHSVLLLFPTGEERGLLGSDHYVADPLWPLDRTLAVVNLDAGAPPAMPVSWRLAGVDSSGLGAAAIRVARDRGWEVATSPPRANSDYFPFHRAGIPAVFVIPGPAPYEGLTADSSAALRSRWDRYHQASDHWYPRFPFEGLQRYAEFALLILGEVDATFRP